MAGFYRTGIFALAIVISCSITGMTGTQLEHRSMKASNATPVYLPDVRFLRLVSLGHENVLADLLWFRTISYFGQHYRSDRSYPWLAHMCDTVTDLDPRAYDVYRFCGMILPWEAERPDDGIRLLEKGIRHLPQSWQLHYWAGFAYYFFKNDYGKAAGLLRRAAELPNGPASALHLAVLLQREYHGPDVSTELLREMAQDADRPEMREIIERHVREHQMALDLKRFGTAVEKYRQQLGRPPASLEDLAAAGLLDPVPADPFGGTYLLDVGTGEVRSSTGHRLSRIHQSPVRLKYLQGQSIRD